MTKAPVFNETGWEPPAGSRLAIQEAQDSGSNGDEPDQFNDIGNSRRLIAASGDELRFVTGLGWHVYDGRVWNQDEMSARIFAQDVARKLYDETIDGNLTGVAQTWARQSGNRPRIDAMLTEALPHLAMEPSELDADPELFNVANGVINLRTGELQPHNRDLFLSKISPVEFNQAATCPKFDSFLQDIQPDQAVRKFIREFFGYSLYGHQDEQCLAFLHGAGSNGKTTLVEALGYIMGSYGVALPFSTLLTSDSTSSKPAPEIVNLRGARRAMASEPDKNQWLSETTIKQLTGGDTVSARLLYSNKMIEFVNVATLWLSGNHKPAVSGTDLGIWRRIHLVPFNETISEKDRDKTMPSKLRKEAAGILNWALKGARIYASEGKLNVPDQVQVASEEYRRENDPLAEFIAEAISPAATLSVQAGNLFAAYEQHCQQNDIIPMAIQRFGRVFIEHGYKKERVGGKTWYRNIELKPEFAPEIPASVNTL